MAAVPVPARALSGAAFGTLLLIAVMMGANHVAARFAFNNGVDVATAVVFRSSITALVIVALLASQGVRVRFTKRHKQALPAIGVLVGIQSLCLYSAVARLPVALALLAFNTYPIWTAFWSAVVYRRHPEKATLIAMPIILAGLAMALDVFGAASGLGASGQWARIGAGVAFALAAAATFGLALVLTQHEAGDVDGRVRTASTMSIAAVIALGTVAVQGGFHLPTAPAGWGGLAALTFPRRLTKSRPVPLCPTSSPPVSAQVEVPVLLPTITVPLPAALTPMIEAAAPPFKSVPPSRIDKVPAPLAPTRVSYATLA